MNRLISLFSVAVTVAAAVSPARSQDSKADMLARNGLTMEAKREYIEMFHESQSDEVRQSCLYELGRLSLKENDFEAAIFNWRLLLQKFPSSDKAGLVRDHVDLLASRLEKVSHANIENKTAVLYLDNGDFHSDDISSTAWVYDTSYLDPVEISLHWYERVISNFPGSEAAEVAYVKIFKTLIGKYGTSGTYGEAGHGFKGARYGKGADRESARRYLSRMVQCFEAYAKNYPSGSFLNQMRFQIGQAYWAINDIHQASDWLNQVVVSGHDSELLTYIARQRLNALKKP